jgi:hypothetical protein
MIRDALLVLMISSPVAARQDIAWGKRYPHPIFCPRLCVSPVFHIDVASCSATDVGYLDAYSRFHFTSRLPVDRQRRIIESLGYDGMIDLEP